MEIIMRLSILAAIAAIVLTTIVACTNPNPNTPEIVAYNNSVIQMWLTVAGVVGSIVAAVTAYMAKRQSGEVSTKLDVQQEELLEKSDRQTHAIVRNTAAAVEEVGQKAAVAVLEVAAKQAATDEESRDRRSTDKPIIGG
jgi:Trk-type K+ transport system membrane component